MSYTKGPWRIGNTSNTEQDIFNGDGSVYIGFVSNTNTQSIEENKANARLIASAPDLLEACKWAFVQLGGQLKNYAVGTDLIHKKEACIKLEQAIAKVEGK